MDSRLQQHRIRRAVIIIIAAVCVSALAAVIIIWFAGLTGSAVWAVVAGLLAALLASLLVTIFHGPASLATKRAFPQTQFVMVPGAGHVAYIEQPALYTNLLHSFLAAEELPLPTINVSTVPEGYYGTK